jgi:cell division protein FtsB
MSNVAFDDQISWEEAVEQQRREFDKLSEPYELKRQQEERLKAEQEAIRAKRQLELFVAKSTLAFLRTTRH